MRIRTLDDLVKKHKLKIGDTVASCVGDGEFLGPILGFELARNGNGNYLRVRLESGLYTASEVCWVPSIDEIEKRARRERERHFEAKIRE